jgi:LacI family transcriptional regulator
MSMDQIKQPSRPGRVTIRTVAADAGVSVAAVSKVLRNAYGVSEALRANVLTSIEKLGYRPNVVARGMRGQTFTIGILLVEIANPFLPDVIDGINDVLGPSNYQAMFAIGQSKMQLEASLIESMIDYRMDGLILVAPQMAGETLARFAAQIPIVAVGHHEPTATTFDTINADDRTGATIAVQDMLDKGFKDIAMVSLDETENFAENVSKAREEGYLATTALTRWNGC